MNSIADSDAVFDATRILVQHQVAVTLLQSSLGNPSRTKLKWLDLGCGRGQIVAHLGENLSNEERAKVHYFGHDIDNGNARNAEAKAQSLGLQSVDFQIGEISNFSNRFGTRDRFDFITLTNTVHEVSPTSLARLFCDCVFRLSEAGCLFIYDMETLPQLELGAVVWSSNEIQAILNILCGALGCGGYRPSVGKWRHTKCCGWSAQIHRSHLGISNVQKKVVNTAIRSGSAEIKRLMEAKLKTVELGLDNLTKYGPQTEGEELSKQRLLYDYWAITRALRA